MAKSLGDLAPKTYLWAEELAHGDAAKGVASAPPTPVSASRGDSVAPPAARGRKLLSHVAGQGDLAPSTPKWAANQDAPRLAQQLLLLRYQKINKKI